MICKFVNFHAIKYSISALLTISLLGCQDQIEGNSQISVLPESSQSDLSDGKDSGNINPDSSTNKSPESREGDETKSDTDGNPDSEGSEYPKESCGTKLPDQRRLYPLMIRPVFVEYSEERLQSIRAEYCKDALKIRRTIKDSQSGEETEKDFIQVASFVIGDPERNYFKEQEFKEFYPDQDLISLGAKEPSFLRELGDKYGTLEEGSKTQVNVPTQLSDKPIQINYELAKAAKLTESQVSQLLSIGEVNIFGQEDIKFILGIILPSYIPDNFVVDEFNVYLQPSGNDQYSLSYRNDNQCFSIHVGPVPPIGDGPSDSKRLDISSEAIPNLVLEYIESDRSEGLEQITTPSGYYTWNNFQAFEFYSPPLSLEPSDCTAISLEQAKKVAESFQFLNP